MLPETAWLGGFSLSVLSSLHDALRGPAPTEGNGACRAAESWPVNWASIHDLSGRMPALVLGGVDLMRQLKTGGCLILSLAAGQKGPGLIKEKEA